MLKSVDVPKVTAAKPRAPRVPSSTDRMKVVQLVERQNRETRATLQALHELAQRGELVGIAICYTTRDGTERVTCTDQYRRPGAGSRAGFLLQMQEFALDELD